MPRKPNLERRQERQNAFLAAFAETGIASLAAKQAGIPGPQHYGWLRDDPAYAERFAELRKQTRDLADHNARKPGPARGTRQGGRRGERRLVRQDDFLEAIGRGLSIMAAARETGMGAPTAHYQWISVDDEYAERFRSAYEKATELRHVFVSAALSSAAEIKWTKPENRENLRKGQQKRRRAESGAMEQTWRQGLFLAAIGEGMPLATAVKDTGITKTIHRQWLEADSDYAAAFGRAYEESAERREQSISIMRAKASATRWNKPGAREEMREWATRHWTPGKRAEWSLQMQEAYRDPTRREQLTAAARAWWDRPDSRAINSERMKRLWEDPEYRERYQAAIDNPERRAKLSEAAKAQWAALSPEEREAKLKNMRRAFKGGHKLTVIEAAVMVALNDREIPHLVHKDIGRYKADILIPSLHLVVECDGAWHHARRIASDRERDEELRTLGFETLRLSEEEIKAKDWSRLDQEIARLTR